MTVIGAKLDAKGDFPRVSSFVDGIEAIAQKVGARLRTHLGEWVLDKTKGLPYVEWTQTKPPDSGLIAAVVASEVAGVESITSIEDLEHSFNTETQTVSVSLRALSSYGYITVGLTQSDTDRNVFPAIIIASESGAIVASFTA